jgi:hypothetical protein
VKLRALPRRVEDNTQALELCPLEPEEIGAIAKPLAGRSRVEYV